ncbi:RDD family protein [Candidatus Wolbachia massiliensis]|uniref:RDD family protein n=1 Tax=Candidatus Wolbachia massiliensis TaxID=1845000 RepID=A0A7M3U2Z6_9RICK|nr:RDD family protein [Candidatus Wolbachia massiliensis]QOD38781.1 RDD family protein [Candidatus Wolbachia massiliensis]
MDTKISYAGVLRRALAYIIDIALWITIAFVTLFFLYFLHYSSTSYNDADDTYRTVIPMVILTVILPVYIMFNILMTTKLGGTPGKLLCGIYIKDASTFTNVTLKQAIIRYFFKDGIWTVCNFLSDPLPGYVSGCLFIVLVSVLMFAILDQRKQTFYDKIAKTVVIDYKPCILKKASNVLSLSISWRREEL